jgi:predicted metal-dependent phosphoesterase TrpH
MSFLYETHMHTCLASKCGKSTGKEHARFYKSIGFTGIIMTDHFFRGNTAVDRELPWEERIDLFWRGYEDAKEEGDRIGLDVFFGLEQNFQGDEYLVYGLTKEYMKAHPEMEHWTRRQQLEEVHKAGGCVIQAHPFRIRNYMGKIRLGTAFCDGIEAANAGNEQIDDARAMLLGRERGLVMTAGSDNHLSGPLSSIYGVELEKRLTSIADYVKIIMEKARIGLKVPEERFIIPADFEMDERHLAWMLDENEQDVPAEKQWLTP